MNIYEKLLKVQQELKAPKNQRNDFGKYNYRNCEDILEAVKPILKEINAVIILSDKLVCINERYYVEATANFIDVESGEKIINTASAREEETKKGMDGSQITGASSSYARKYALNGLLAIDDNKDSDYTNTGNSEKCIKTSQYKCEKCGKEFKDGNYGGTYYTAKDLYEMAKQKNNGVALCKDCNATH